MAIGFQQVLDQFTTRELADALGCPYPTAQAMKRRGAVSPRHWQALINAAEQRGFPLNGAALAHMAIERKSERVS